MFWTTLSFRIMHMIAARHSCSNSYTRGTRPWQRIFVLFLPAQVLISGYEWTSEDGSRAPVRQVTKSLLLIQECLTKPKFTLKTLQIIIGTLNFACVVVLPGRVSLRRLIDLTIGVSKPHYFIRITKEAREDCTCGQISLPTSTGGPSSWQNNQFAHKYSISEQFPVRVSNLALFIAYLVNQSYKPSTISSYVSAVDYVHKLKAIPDPTSSFLILKLLRACHKQQKSVDTRMPIVKPMLERLMLTLVHTGTDQYRQHLFQAMFSLAFYAFLRIGEIITRGKDRHNAHLIQKN